MQRIRFLLLPADGSGKTSGEGTWADVLEAIPYLLMPGGPVPPRQIVNEVLKTGKADAGMSGGCEWPPTELSETDYEEVVLDLLARPSCKVQVDDELYDTGPYKRLAAPEWVQTKDDYRYWKVEVSRGIPALKHRELSRRVQRLAFEAGQVRKAYPKDDGDAGDELELRRAEEELAELWAQYDRWPGRHPADPPASNVSYTAGGAIRGLTSGPSPDG